MALFDDILADVITITNRPDLVNESKFGIRAATIKLHGLELWIEDKIEEVIPVVVEDGMFAITNADFSHTPRKIDLFKKTTSDDFFEEINPLALKDRYGYRRSNVYYRAGTQYNFITDTYDNSIAVSYYRFPVATETGYSSWIAENYKELVALEAAIFVFSSIGDKEQEARIEKMAAQQLAVLQINHMNIV